MKQKIPLGKIFIQQADYFGEYEWEKDDRRNNRYVEAENVQQHLDNQFSNLESIIQIEEDLKEEVVRRISRSAWAEIIRKPKIALPKSEKLECENKLDAERKKMIDEQNGEFESVYGEIRSAIEKYINPEKNVSLFMSYIHNYEEFIDKEDAEYKERAGDKKSKDKDKKITEKAVHTEKLSAAQQNKLASKTQLKFGRSCLTCQYNTGKGSGAFSQCKHIDNNQPIWNKAYCYNWELKLDESWLEKHEIGYLERIYKDKSKFPSLDPKLRKRLYKPNPKQFSENKTKIRCGQICFFCENRGELRENGKVECLKREKGRGIKKDTWMVWEFAKCSKYKLSRDWSRFNQFKSYMKKSGVDVDSLNWWK